MTEDATKQGVPVDQLTKGDFLTLPQSDKEVRVERVDYYENGTYVVRWKAGDALGSFRPMAKGEIVADARRQHAGTQSLTGVVESL